MVIGKTPPNRSEGYSFKPVFVLLTLLSVWIFATIILLATQGVIYPGFLLLTVLPVTFAFVLYHDSHQPARRDPRDRLADVNGSVGYGFGHQPVERA